jgi:polysaccharide pyruvyl transferase WcaK-like protein
MKKSICFSGYYGPGNYGDELMRLTLAESMPEFTTFNFRTDIHTSDLKSGISSGFEDSQAVIVGGGDLIHPSVRLPRFWDRRLLEKPVFVYGVGVPRQAGESDEAIAFYKDFLSHDSVKMIVARDPQSADWIRQKLSLQKPVEYFPDIVWARNDNRPMVKSKQFALITRPMGQSLAYGNIVKLCAMAKQRGYHIRHIVLGVGNIAQTDLAEAVMLPFSSRDIVIRPTVLDLINEMSQASVIASMKFHGCVSAFMMGIPVLSLLKHSKFSNLFENFAVADHLSSYDDVALMEKAERVFDESAKVDGGFNANLADVQQRSREGIMKLVSAIRQQIQ